MTYQGHVRQPSGIAWIIASGRLKKVACNQLRHASERERLVAEGTTQVTTPWTFQDLSGLISKGEYDDEILTEKQFRKEAQQVRRRWEEDSEARPGQKRQLPEELPDASSTGHATSSAAPAGDATTCFFFFIGLIYVSCLELA